MPKTPTNIDPVEAVHAPHFNVIVMDMQGVQYVFTEEKGIHRVKTFTIEDGTKGEEVYTKAVKELHTQLCGQAVKELHVQLYGQGALSQFEGSLVVEQATEAKLVERILTRKEAPCGIALCSHAAEYVYRAINANMYGGDFRNDVYKIIVVSSALEEVSKAILRANLARFPKRNKTQASLDEILGVIDFHNMAKFGSKKNPDAWAEVFKRIKEKYPYANDCIRIYEDHPAKRQAAVQGAERNGFRTEGANVINLKSDGLPVHWAGDASYTGPIVTANLIWPYRYRA